MRIAWLVPGALDQRTGGYLYDRLIVERLRARGDAVQVFDVSRKHLGPVLAREIADGRMDAVVGDALAAGRLGEIFARLEKSTTRVLLVHHLTSWENDAPRAEARQEEEGRAIGASDAMIATSGGTAQRLAVEYGRVADVVVPGANRLAPRAAPVRGPQETPGDRSVVFLFVGALVPRKRLPLLLQAMERLAAPHAKLRIVGDPARDAEHAYLIDTLVARSPYLAARVSIQGPIDDDALAEELSRADALVLPSSLEGYGMVLTEAVRGGIPVIAARAWAPPEVATVPDLALLFEDEHGLLTCLQRFTGEPALRARMRAAAEARGRSLPTWDAASSSFRNALTRAAAAMRASPEPTIGPSR